MPLDPNSGAINLRSPLESIWWSITLRGLSIEEPRIKNQELKTILKTIRVFAVIVKLF
jgi:hypothetical protein